MFSLVSVGTFAVGIALAYKLGFVYGFSCGRDDQVVLARIIEHAPVWHVAGVRRACRLLFRRRDLFHRLPKVDTKRGLRQLGHGSGAER